MLLQGFIGVPGGGLATGVGTVVTIISSILGALFGPLFGGGGNADAAIQQLRDQVVNIGNTLAQLAIAVARTIGRALIFLGNILFSLVKPLLSLLGKILQKLADIYFKYLKPIIDAIQKIRARILKIYDHYLRPVLLIFQKVHQVLTILKLFHLKFAAKLDQELMKLEAKLTAPLYQLLRYLNQVGNMLNLVFDATLIMRRAVTLNALDGTKGAWSQMWWNVQTAPVSSQAFLELKKAADPDPLEDLGIYFDEFAFYGTGPYAEALALVIDQVPG